MALFSWLPGGAGGVTPAEIRAEIWRLGGRHRGRPLDGALAELNSKDLEPARATLLRACVRELQRP